MKHSMDRPAASSPGQEAGDRAPLTWRRAVVGLDHYRGRPLDSRRSVEAESDVLGHGEALTKRPPLAAAEAVAVAALVRADDRSESVLD